MTASAGDFFALFCPSSIRHKDGRAQLSCSNIYKETCRNSDTQTPSGSFLVDVTAEREQTREKKRRRRGKENDKNKKH